ncbi:NAD(P)-dependent oxidoreductase [Tsuneonella sp. SYSU-LHT278]|uniref:NAD(P)-dependent oxidoreductase n=1 Tax=Tsuneonella sediminis TaxID=3416089 RepID=UPI003F7B0AF3
MIVQVLEPEDFPGEARELLATLGEVVPGEIDAARRSQVGVVFTRLARRLDAAFHADYPALRWIVSPTTGLDHIDLDHFAAAGVGVISLRGETAFLDTIHATAEHTLALTLALLRDLPGAAAAVAAGRWDRTRHKGRELFGKTVVLLGYGRIGRLVHPIFEAFGCRVVAHDIVAGRVPATLACDWPRALTGADILSVHLPLNGESAGFVDGALLDRLPPRAIVVNTARGAVVDQEALLDRLEDGRLAGAALDVLAGEPEPLDGELAARIAALGPRLVVTPHIGGYTWESLDAVEIFVARRLLEAIDAAR